MIKITGNLDLEKDLQKYLETSLKKAFKKTSAKTVSTIQSHAESKLRKGLKKWRDGFQVHDISDDTFIISISGKLALMMEDKISPSEISNMIMNGNRARHNKAEGKDYVDVPLEKSTVSSVKVFKDADSLMKQFEKKSVNISDPKNQTVVQEDRHLRRVKNLIESKKKIDGKSQFMVIKRVTSKSRWPTGTVPGVKAIDKGVEELERNFEKVLKEVL